MYFDNIQTASSSGAFSQLTMRLVGIIYITLIYKDIICIIFLLVS